MVVYAALLREIRQTPRRNRYRGLRMQKQALGCSITSLKGESGCKPVSHRIQIRIASDTIGSWGLARQIDQNAGQLSGRAREGRGRTGSRGGVPSKTFGVA